MSVNTICSSCGHALFYSPRTLAESSGGRPFKDWVLEPSMANQLHLDGTPMCESAHVRILEWELRGLLCSGVEK